MPALLFTLFCVVWNQPCGELVVLYSDSLAESVQPGSTMLDRLLLKRKTTTNESGVPFASLSNEEWGYFLLVYPVSCRQWRWKTASSRTKAQCRNAAIRQPILIFNCERNINGVTTKTVMLSSLVFLFGIRWDYHPSHSAFCAQRVAERSHWPMQQLHQLQLSEATLFVYRVPCIERDDKFYGAHRA